MCLTTSNTAPLRFNGTICYKRFDVSGGILRTPYQGTRVSSKKFVAKGKLKLYAYERPITSYPSRLEIEGGYIHSYQSLIGARRTLRPGEVIIECEAYGYGYYDDKTSDMCSNVVVLKRVVMWGDPDREDVGQAEVRSKASKILDKLKDD